MKSKPKKQAKPPKVAAPVKKESEDVRMAEEAEIRRGMSQRGRQSSNLLKSNYGSTNKSNLLG
tara:strand:- start:572 stop:760 length:189 start_codon:yes stop_codon:yes gene_type:complete